MKRGQLGVTVKAHNEVRQRFELTGKIIAPPCIETS